jgi:hypothetical protein
MANNPRNKDNLKPFKKGKVSNPNGRPPKLLTSLVSELKALGYERATATTVTETIEHLITLPEEELKTLLADKTQPMSVRIIIKSLLSGKGFETLLSVLDRAHGKPKQQMDVATTGEQVIEVKVKITKDDLRSDPIE